MVDRREPRDQAQAFAEINRLRRRIGLPLIDESTEQTVSVDPRSHAEKMLSAIGRESWYMDSEGKPLMPEKAVDITDRTELEEGSVATLAYFETAWGHTVDIIVTRFISDSSSSCDYNFRGDKRFSPGSPSFQLTARSLKIDPQSLHDIVVANAPQSLEGSS